MLLYQGCQGVAVDIAHLAGAHGLIRRHHLVAARQDRHAGGTRHVYAGDTQGHQTANFGWAQAGSGRQHRLAGLHIFAGAQLVFTRRGGPQQFHLARTGGLGVLNHHHRVSTLGQHPAGVDQGSLSGLQAKSRRGPHGHLTHQAQVGRQAVGRAKGITRAHGKAIYGRARKGRQRFRRDHRMSGHPAKGRGRIHQLSQQRRVWQMTHQRRQGLGGG